MTEAEVAQRERELRKIELQYRKATAKAEELRVERNRKVCEAVEAGMKQVAVSRITGLNTSRIGQIIHS